MDGASGADVARRGGAEMGGNDAATLSCRNFAILRHVAIRGGLAGELTDGSERRFLFFVLLRLGKMTDAAGEVRRKLGRRRGDGNAMVG